MSGSERDPSDRGPHRRGLTTLGVAGMLFAIGSAPAVAQGHKQGAEKEVTATEDLMREHGVLRRALLVYSESADLLRRGTKTVDPGALHQTALLFRVFGEDYHEKKLEEAHIFPAVRKAGGPVAAMTDVLVQQHDRGREITEYILALTARGAIGTGQAGPFAAALDAMVRMYRNHAAREDTIVFPAWKQALSGARLHEMGERFEEIEHQQFGRDGFDDAVKKIGEIEQALGFADLAQFTAAPPSKP